LVIVQATEHFRPLW